MDQKIFWLASWTWQQNQNKKTGRKTQKKMGDDINEVIKPGETNERKKYDLMNNNNWVMEAKKYKEWKEKGGKVYEKSAANFWNDARNVYTECFALTHPTQVLLSSRA